MKVGSLSIQSLLDNLASVNGFNLVRDTVNQVEMVTMNRKDQEELANAHPNKQVALTGVALPEPMEPPTHFCSASETAPTDLPIGLALETSTVKPPGRRLKPLVVSFFSSLIHR